MLTQHQVRLGARFSSQSGRAPGETQVFLSFVQLLASKSLEERQMLLHAALQEAHGSSGPTVAESTAAARGTAVLSRQPR